MPESACASAPGSARASAARRGRRGERAAARCLRSAGLRVVGRNHRVGRDEIDVLACDVRARVLVLAEVKTRAAGADAARAVGAAKRRRMVRAARRLRAQRRYRGWSVRYDVVVVAWAPAARRPRVRHLPDAFRPGGG